MKLFLVLALLLVAVPVGATIWYETDSSTWSSPGAGQPRIATQEALGYAIVMGALRLSEWPKMDCQSRMERAMRAIEPWHYRFGGGGKVNTAQESEQSNDAHRLWDQVKRDCWSKPLDLP